jgi:hypothetical protein
LPGGLVLFQAADPVEGAGLERLQQPGGAVVAFGHAQVAFGVVELAELEGLGGEVKAMSPPLGWMGMFTS